MVRTHAHEEDIPGTVNLQAVEGDDTVYGQAIYPVPSDDPNDPLNWSSFRKAMILIICSVYSFLGNSALLGPSVYISIYSQDFGVSPAVASGLISYPNLAFGFSSLVLVPLYLKIGRRPVMLGSMLCVRILSSFIAAYAPIFDQFIVALAGASQATNFESLMVARVIHGFASGICEALPVQIVNDIFFLHERGKKIGYYTICLCMGSTGPLFAGLMLSAGYSWRLYFYVEIAFSGVLFVLAFFFAEESRYHRHLPIPSSSDNRPVSNSHPSEKNSDDLQHIEEITFVPQRKSFTSTLKPWSSIDKDTEFFMTMARSFAYFSIPSVVWVITTYGINIGLGALVFNFTFPLKIVAPPYNWSQDNSGLIAIGIALGLLLATPFASTSDRLAAYLTKRNNGIREAEMRLPVLLLSMLIGPAALVVYGFTAERNLHWIGYFIGVAVFNWSELFYFSFTLAYAVDSYNVNTSEMLIAMNLGKQAISFGIGSYLLDWILQRGYAVVIAGIFGSLLLANNLGVLVFMAYGKGIRRYTATSWMGKMHGKTSEPAIF